MPEKKSPPSAEGQPPPLNGKPIQYALIVLGVAFDESKFPDDREAMGACGASSTT